MTWTIHLYETLSGQPVIEKFIDRLQAPTQAKLIRQFELLEEFGPELGMPHAKPLGDGLYELRVRGKQEVRAFYLFAKGKHIYVIHAVIKKSQTLSKKELNIARKRKTEIESL
jgi:phage-related protein